jgi:hypothetical protein
MGLRNTIKLTVIALVLFVTLVAFQNCGFSTEQYFNKTMISVI